LFILLLGDWFTAESLYSTRNLSCNAHRGGYISLAFSEHHTDVHTEPQKTAKKKATKIQKEGGNKTEVDENYELRWKEDTKEKKERARVKGLTVELSTTAGLLFHKAP
jgi:hypothetical protein